MPSSEKLLDRTKAESFLLGSPETSERLNFECEVFADESLSEQLELLRHQLSEEYLDGQIDSVRRSQFEDHFLSFPYNAEIFRFQKALRSEIESRNAASVEKAPVTRIAPSKKKTGLWSKVFEYFTVKTFAAPAFGALLLLLLGGFLWYSMRKETEFARSGTPSPTTTPAERAENSQDVTKNLNGNNPAIERDRNKPTATPAPVNKKEVIQQASPVVATITLLGSFRDIENREKPVMIGRETRTVTLIFQYPKVGTDAGFKAYKLIVERMSGDKTWEGGLSTGRRAGERLSENISPDLLQNGQYRFRIVGVSADDREETVKSETFFVKRVD